MGKVKAKRLIAFCLVCCLMTMSMMAGCSKKGGSTDTTNDGNKNTTSDNNTTNSDTNKNTASDTKEEEKVSTPDPYKRYDETVTITVARRTFGTEKINEYWKETLLRDHNINVEIALEADAAQFDEKVNVAITSGTIPDVMMVNPQQMDTLLKADMVADLTQALDYLAPETRKYIMEGTGAEALASVTYDGKVRFIPANITSLLNNAFPVFIRKDWLDNLGLPIPKTVEDFKKVAIAFAKDDPDQNGKDDTYGLALSGQSNLVHDWGGLYGFFSAYGVQPCTWYDYMIFYSKDETGNIVWDGEKPEVKEGLQLLADLYKEGAIPKDFITMDNNKIIEDMNGGKGGITFGVRGLPYWAIQNTIKNNPDAEWYAMNMPTKDGSPAPIFVYQPVNNAIAISATCKNPEAVIIMLNSYYKYADPESPNFDPMTLDTTVTAGEFVAFKNPDEEMDNHRKLFDAIKKQDKSSLNLSLQTQYDEVMEYVNTKNPERWSRWNAIYPEDGHAYYLVFGTNTEDMLKKNLWWKMPSENMVQKLPLYRDMAQETMAKIIAGAEPVSAWDDMVAQWNKLGGDEITKEVMEAAK